MSLNGEMNQGRIKAVVEKLELLEQSAAANKTSAEELAEFLQPVTTVINRMLPETAPRPLTGHREEPEVAGQWAAASGAPALDTVHDMAADAPLSELSTALAVYMSRVDEHLAETKQ